MAARLASRGAHLIVKRIRLALIRRFFARYTTTKPAQKVAASNICPGRRPGSSANTGCPERRNTISPTCRRRRTCAPWRPPSRRRWICEQAHQQLKEELGLDHFEGRSWQGAHRHALMTMIAYAFLQHRRLSTARRERKKSNGPSCSPAASFLRSRRAAPSVGDGYFGGLRRAQMAIALFGRRV